MIKNKLEISGLKSSIFVIYNLRHNRVLKVYILFIIFTYYNCIL